MKFNYGEIIFRICFSWFVLVLLSASVQSDSIIPTQNGLVRACFLDARNENGTILLELGFLILLLAKLFENYMRIVIVR